MLLTMKMTKLMNFNKFLRLKCIFFSGPKLMIRPISLPSKIRSKNKVLKFGFLGGKYGINGLIKGHQGVQKCSAKFRQSGAL